MNFETSRPCIIPNPEDIVSLESLSAHASARDTPPCSARFNATWSSLNLSPIPLLSLRRCDSNSSDGEKVQVKIVGVGESFVLDVKSNIEVFVLKSIIAERLDVCQSRIVSNKFLTNSAKSVT